MIILFFKATASNNAYRLMHLALRLIKVNGYYIAQCNPLFLFFMKQRIPDPILMLITILVIIGFQVYWIKDNYKREKRSLEIRAGVAFQESIRQLQIAKLKLPKSILRLPAHKPSPKILSDEDFDDINNGTSKPRSQIITMVNTLRSSVKNDSNSNSTVIITTRKGGAINDSSFIKLKNGADSNRHTFNILYGVDSLQDSLTIAEINKSYSAALKKENIPISFSITRLNNISLTDEDELKDVTVGFAHPLTYHLTLQNTTGFLFKRLTLPILFSVFLIAVTILSFVLMYRNLLKQQRLADIKNEFISNITHELKTPIATVSVAIEAMKNFNALQSPERTAEYLDIAENELQRLTMLVDKVLKLSMFEQQQIELKYDLFDLHTLTAEVLKSMRLQFEKYKATVTLNSNGMDFNIKADRVHITSVLYNLIDNALKYSVAEPKINILIEEKENAVQLSIADNGKGIPAIYKDKVFEKFFRVPHGDSHNIKGYGLGLSYVSHIIAQHNGMIEVESEEGKGSTFIIKLARN
jgi:two-component system phosphate regulon sensor histidine kinase PhoR